MKYDPSVIENFAALSYRRAKSTVGMYTIIAAALGAVGGFTTSGEARFLPIFALVVFGALVGYKLGRDRAFRFKREAQTALVQVQIEMNTRQPGNRPNPQSESWADSG